MQHLDGVIAEATLVVTEGSVIPQMKTSNARQAVGRLQKRASGPAPREAAPITSSKLHYAKLRMAGIGVRRPDEN